MAERRLRVRFQVSLVTLVSALVALLAAGLIWLQFNRTTAIMQEAAFAFIDQVAERTAEKVKTQFEPVLHDLRTIAALPQLQQADQRFDPTVMTLLGAMVRELPQVLGAFIGFEDGAVLWFDELAQLSPADRQAMGAPGDAKFMTWEVIPRPDGTRLRTTRYYDGAMVEIGTPVEVPETTYDARTRPWYKGAFEPDASPFTRPYVYENPKVVGYAVRVPLTTGQVRGVIAADLLMTEVSGFLDTIKIGRTGSVMMFDDELRVVAHPRLQELTEIRISDAGDQVTLPTVGDLGVGEYTVAIKDWRTSGLDHHSFRIDGREHIAAFRDADLNFEAPTASGLNLMVVAPLDEFFEDILEMRKHAIVVALLLAAIALPAVFFLSRRLSYKLRALAEETDRIQSFNIVPAPRIVSRITEIDDLGRSVDTMKTVVRTFGSFVPKRLVEQLIATGTALELGGARHEVTVLFTDIRNFTPIAEGSDAESLMRYTSRYLAALSEAVMANGGTVDKYIGDSVMAFWNAPQPHPDHVAQACAGVLACRAANRAINEKFKAEGWHQLGTRYGLHVGEAVVGNIGSAERMNYTVIGATINLAARLEGLNGTYGTEVLVSGPVVERVAERFIFRAVDTVQPKGIKTPMPVFELRGMRDGSPAAAAEVLYCDEWADAFRLYMARDWSAALDAFNKFAERHPRDTLAQIYRGRAGDYIDDPPGDDWNPVAIFKTK